MVHNNGHHTDVSNNEVLIQAVNFCTHKNLSLLSWFTIAPNVCSSKRNVTSCHPVLPGPTCIEPWAFSQDDTHRVLSHRQQAECSGNRRELLIPAPVLLPVSSLPFRIRSDFLSVSLLPLSVWQPPWNCTNHKISASHNSSEHLASLHCHNTYYIKIHNELQSHNCILWNS